MHEELVGIIMENELLIRKIASKFYGLDADDLFQAGVMGIIKAFRNFKDDGSAKFSSYAYEYVFGEMYNLSMQNRDIKVNKDILRLKKKIEEARNVLIQHLKKMPSITDIALFLEVEESLIQSVELATQSIMSLDVTYDENGEMKFYDVVASKVENSIDDQIILQDTIMTLDEDQKKIIDFRYYQDYTQEETAKALKMTQAMVSRYERKALENMRSKVAV